MSSLIITADEAVCSRMIPGMHLSSAKARRVVEVAEADDYDFETVVRATADVLRAELFIEQRLLQAALDIVRAVRGES